MAKICIQLWISRYLKEITPLKWYACWFYAGFSLLFFAGQPLDAQIPTFKKRYGTAANDEARAVAVLPDGSFIIAGASNGGGLGGDDALIVRFSADGEVTWNLALGGSGTDFFMNLLECSDGNLIAVGETNSFGAGNFDIFVVKISPGGTVIWERTLGGPDREEAGGATEVADGYVITGSTQSYGAGSWDMYMEKLDFDGNAIWQRAWGQGGGDKLGESLPSGSGGVWTSGLNFIGSNNHDAPILEVDGSGNTTLTLRIAAPLNDNGYFMAPGGAGFVVSGTTFSYSNGAQQQPWMNSFNGSGALIWSKRYLMPTGNYIIHVEDCPDGGFVFAPFQLNNDVNVGYLVKTDENGDIIWAKSYSLQGNGRLRHVRPTPDGGYVVVGYTSGNGRDLLVIKTDPQGNIATCCPEDAPITAVAVTPTLPSTTLQNANGQAALLVTALEASPDLAETDICTSGGPSCCITYAGTLTTQMADVCINGIASIVHAGNEVLEQGDLLQFVLFSDPNDTLGSIIVVQNTPEFTFDPMAMQTGVTYYVAAIAGDNTGGNVALNDPCLDISNAVQLSWRPLPTVTLSVLQADVCQGACTSIMASFSGTPPFSLTYAVPGIGPAVQTFADIQGNFQVCVPANASIGIFSIAAVELQDAFCTCP